MYTLPVALAMFAIGQYQADYGLLMAGSVVLVVPVRSSSCSQRVHPELRHDRHQGLEPGAYAPTVDQGRNAQPKRCSLVSAARARSRSRVALPAAAAKEPPA